MVGGDVTLRLRYSSGRRCCCRCHLRGLPACRLLPLHHPPLLQTFSKLFRRWPSAIAYPNNTEAVAAAVKCAAKFKAAVHPRCGGHGNEGAGLRKGVGGECLALRFGETSRPLFGERGDGHMNVPCWPADIQPSQSPHAVPPGESVTTGALTIDLSRMGTVRMAEDGNSVTVQGGARVGQ